MLEKGTKLDIALCGVYMTINKITSCKLSSTSFTATVLWWSRKVVMKQVIVMEDLEVKGNFVST